MPANSSPFLTLNGGAVSGIIAASQTVTLKYPTGGTYSSLKFYCVKTGSVACTRAELEASIAKITVSCSGKYILFTGTMREFISKIEFYRGGLIGDTGVVTVPFAQQFMREAPWILNPEVGTRDQSSVEVELVFSGSSVITNVTAYSVVDKKIEDLGAHIETYRTTLSINNAGLFLFPDIPKIPGRAISALFLVYANATEAAKLDNISLQYESERIVNQFTQPLLNSIYRDCDPQRTPQTGVVALDLQARGLLGDILPQTSGVCYLELNHTSAPTGGVSLLIDQYVDDTVQPAR